MEALLLAGGKAERPRRRGTGASKAAGAHRRLPARGVQRSHDSSMQASRVVIVACRAGQEEAFVDALGGVGAEIEPVGEHEPLGRGGGLRLAASRRRETGSVLALNGDELLDVDFEALLAEHEQAGAGATIVVAQVRSPFGVVDLEDDGRVTGFREAPMLDDWVNSGVYALGRKRSPGFPRRATTSTARSPSSRPRASCAASGIRACGSP